MQIDIPDFSLVVLIGASGSGKSTFARMFFKPTEVVSSDWCRGLLSDDENDQSVSKEAFELLYYLVGKRLSLRRLTVVDATNVDPTYRKQLIAIARKHHALPVAIVLNVPAKVCEARNRERPDRTFGGRVIRNQIATMRRSLRGLKREGFRVIHHLTHDDEGVGLWRKPVWSDKRAEAGPFDIIGDVHGCFDELCELLAALGWTVDHAPAADDERRSTASHPDGRRLVFVGDLVDRGPASHEVLKLVMDLREAGVAFCVPGNHDVKLLRKLRGHDVKLNYGLAETVAQLATTSDAFQIRVRDFLDSLVSHLWLDDGRLVVAHAGIKADMIGRGSGEVRQFTLYGETTGETDEFGLPIRYRWAEDYRGEALVVYGHTPVVEPDWLNRTVNIDTGCCFGGKLTALRYPGRECVSVDARKVHSEPIRPIGTGTRSKHGDDYGSELNIDDVLGKQIVRTRLHHTVTIREENSRAALEVMSRFAVHPGWLVYLPPTMSPSETSEVDGHLERPEEALRYYAKRGVPRVVCEEKHMGSRAIVVIAKDEAVAAERFGVDDGAFGSCYTRTGRPFFPDRADERAFLERTRAALTASDVWADLATDWVVLDCELMPWSAKARALIRGQYAATFAAGRTATDHTIAELTRAVERIPDAAKHLARMRTRQDSLTKYASAYRRYCWPVDSLDDYRLAPFHVMASEGRVHADRDHAWHMAMCHRIAAADPAWILATTHRVVSLDDEAAVRDAVTWWETLTEAGGEGMVVKPLDFVARDGRGLLQPALKSRGREYLRIIYGPDYDAPENLRRLRKRGLSHKRSLALREFALGLEGLERFVNREPLSAVHQCAFGVLALESEPVDPRL